MIFKKLHQEAIEPTRSTALSAGLDLFALSGCTLYPGESRLISTGITFVLTADDTLNPWYIGIYIRSSLALNGLMLGNGVGIVDADFEGNEIKVILHNASEKIQAIGARQKIAQMIVHPHLSNTAGGVTFKHDARTGGFGSTNNEKA